MTDLDPELVAEVSCRARSSTAHHEAGHAVAAVARGGTLIKIHLGYADWSTLDTSGDLPAETHHRSSKQNLPFVTFAGPWATAKWTIQNDPGVDDFDDALEYAFDNATDGDGAKYDGVVEQLKSFSATVGVPLGWERPWEYHWINELEPLWPAVCEIAAMLIDGQTVVHDQVQAAIDRCPDN
ncbi:hypothetical protein [Mycobacterium vicinigordonae]|uniref:Peptidase M41 domain-containing protein n=1 Tax=Mycobacterium vicinigordonae TaxID=1719132 RepID=A0A7D6HWB4_9MYCO|nr:hypothetical protein [Mycobacterium vicinigordonae]QLL08992.1 hypothetical protein H0P51_08920 [Mycobacterium vicinigordonae]